MELGHLLTRAVALQTAGEIEAARALYEQVLRAAPNQFDALHLLGMVEFAKGNTDDAITLISRALATFPASAEALSNRAFVRLAQNRPEQAILDCDKALHYRPEFPAALVNKANALVALGENERAVGVYRRALSANPTLVEASTGLAAALCALGEYAEALAHCDHAIALRPTHVDALINRGQALHGLGRTDEALDCYDRAIQMQPNAGHALFNRGALRCERDQFIEGAEDLRRALAIRHFDGALGQMLHAQMHLCNWSRYSVLLADLLEQLRNGVLSTAPFPLLGVSDDSLLQRACAEHHARQRNRSRMTRLWNGERYRHDKVRIAYVSADFRSHPTSFLMFDVWRRHAPTFETFALSLGPREDTPWAREVRNSFDRFVDCSSWTSQQIAQFIRDEQVSVAVDLMGYTSRSRPEVFASRPAPVQINFLGYPGTMGVSHADFIIADDVVLPENLEQAFVERVVRLPHTYQPCSTKRPSSAPTRRDHNLPDVGFVFCCFCNNWKITPQVFDVWMRLLHKVPDSVLWLLSNSDDVVENLRHEASVREIDPQRLIFAPRLPHDEHLARQTLADVFLDTVPYNAHTTASDAIAAGVPLITTLGNSFQSRVAASVLKAAGLDDFVMPSLAEYEQLALTLARDSVALAAARAKVAAAQTSPLFDTADYCRHLEAIFARVLHDVLPADGVEEASPDISEAALSRVVARERADAGDLVWAERLYRRTLLLDPEDGDAKLELGRLLYKTGDVNAAIQQFEGVLVRSPDHVEAKSFLAAALAFTGEPGRVRQMAREAAVAAGGNNALAHFALGVAHWRLHEPEQAFRELQRACALDANSADALAWLAQVHLDLGDAIEASRLAKEATEKSAHNPWALRVLGRVHMRQGNVDDAAEHFTAAAQALLADGSYDLVVAVLSEMDQSHLTDPKPQNLLGLAHYEQRQFPEAISCFEAALSGDPHYVEAKLNLAASLSDSGRLEEAETLLRSMTSSATESVAEAWHNLGNTLTKMRRSDDAMSSYRKALECKSDLNDSRLGIAFSLLQRGHYREGWSEYRCRVAPLDLPLWDGGPVGEGHSICVIHEQGLGDNLQFVRLLPKLRTFFDEVAFVAPPPLARLLRGNLPGVRVREVWPRSPRRYTHYAHLLSLGEFFVHSAAMIPGDAYLAPLDDSVCEWAQRLERSDGLPKIGLCWAGGTLFKHDGDRSTRLSEWDPLFDSVKARWISLQVGAPAEELASRRSTPIERFDNLISDFADTAGLLSQLDLVVTVDTAVAHLAGAMGRPVWMANRFAGDWRWGVDQTSTPWYPTMKIFNQKRPGDWESVTQGMESDLQEAIALRSNVR